jgi:predicted MFS family arabinose efflux permease
MAAFTSTEVSVATATPVKVADSDDFIRRVYTSDNTGAFRLGFTSGAASTGAFVNKLSPASSGAVDFPLPAGQELWAYQASGSTQVINVLVTAEGEV